MSVYTYRRGSIFWALTLIGVGALFLWQNFNPSVHPWQLIAKYWPVLIIFWGLSKLIDYIQAQAHPDTTPPPLFSGSEVLMLVLILVLGTIISRVVLHPWQQWGWHVNDDEISGLFLNSYSYNQTLSQPTQGDVQLVLSDQRGPVEIRGADQSTIEVMAKETVRAEDERAAKKISDDLKLDLVHEVGHYVLSSNRPSLPDDGRRVTLDLSLSVPKDTSSQVNSESGDIAVNDLTGDQMLTAHKGDVRAASVKGLVKIHKAGGSTEVHDVKGSVELEGRGDDIELADVSDTVTVHGEFSGALQFRNIGQTLRYESLRTDMTAQKLSGHLNMEVGSLEVSGIDGPLEITTRQKDITVNEFRHGLRINNTDGQISLQTSTPPTHDIQVTSKNGGVELSLPADSNFQIQADSRHGEVECDFSGPNLKVVKEGNTPSITGSYGKAGPMIRITTEYGSIRLLRAGSKPSSPSEPLEPSGKAQTTRRPRAARPRHFVPLIGYFL